MEQEPERILFSDTIKRVGYKMRLGVHLFFIGLAFASTAVLLITLVVSAF
jgi:hypothetical protein